MRSMALCHGAEKKEPRRRYFYDSEEFYRELLRRWAPEAKPWRAAKAIEHEIAHERYARTVGAIGVRYSHIRKKPGSVMIETIYPQGVTIPNLVATAVSANPIDSWYSPVDRGQMIRYGYKSRSYIKERIRRWNEQGFGPPLPELETVDEALARVAYRVANIQPKVLQELRASREGGTIIP